MTVDGQHAHKQYATVDGHVTVPLRDRLRSRINNMVFTASHQPIRHQTSRPIVKTYLIDEIRSLFPAWANESDGRLIEMALMLFVIQPSKVNSQLPVPIQTQHTHNHEQHISQQQHPAPSSNDYTDDAEYFDGDDD